MVGAEAQAQAWSSSQFSGDDPPPRAARHWGASPMRRRGTAECRAPRGRGMAAPTRALRQQPASSPAAPASKTRGWQCSWAHLRHHRHSRTQAVLPQLSYIDAVQQHCTGATAGRRLAGVYAPGWAVPQQQDPQQHFKARGSRMPACYLGLPPCLVSLLQQANIASLPPGSACSHPG